MRNRQEVKKEWKSGIPTAGVGGIDLFVGAEGVRLRDAIEAWRQGRLMEATDENACK